MLVCSIMMEFLPFRFGSMLICAFSRLSVFCPFMFLIIIFGLSVFSVGIGGPLGGVLEVVPCFLSLICAGVCTGGVHSWTNWKLSFVFGLSGL